MNLTLRFLNAGQDVIATSCGTLSETPTYKYLGISDSVYYVFETLDGTKQYIPTELFFSHGALVENNAYHLGVDAINKKIIIVNCLEGHRIGNDRDYSDFLIYAEDNIAG